MFGPASASQLPQPADLFAAFPRVLPLNRPHKLAELVEFVKTDWDHNKPLTHWLRLGGNLRKAGNAYAENGDLESGFVYLAMAATLILENIPSHPRYSTLTLEQRDALLANGNVVLDTLGKVKGELASRYDHFLSAGSASRSHQSPNPPPVPPPPYNYDQYQSGLFGPRTDIPATPPSAGSSNGSSGLFGPRVSIPQRPPPSLVPGPPPMRPPLPPKPQRGASYESIPPRYYPANQSAPGPSAPSPVFPPVSMRGPFVEHSIYLLRNAVITGDHSDVLALPRAEMQCIVDVIHEMLLSHKHSTQSSSSFRTPTMAKETRDALRRLTMKLCFAHSIVPQALVLKGLVISDRDSIGGGGFADIYKGTYRQVPVALKRLRVFLTLEESRRESLRRTFYREALIWHQLDHPHILNLLGVSEDASGTTLSMVLPWIEYGNVRQHLDKKMRETQFRGPFFLSTILRWLLEIAQGLSYLHSEGVVHGDLRGVNILVDSTGKMRLADFGLAVIAEAGQSLTVTTRGGAFGWLAPELIDPESFGLDSTRPTFASDVYSFACVCIELFSCQSPFVGVGDAQIVMRVCRGQRPPRPNLRGQTMPDVLWDLINLYTGPDSDLLWVDTQYHLCRYSYGFGWLDVHHPVRI
ncbi:hypothetical protein NLI96_g4827 [Meripilus lineatus]|uniref:Protein kinase domain-containing protein n=1 Tax=Meripilus lineatus TaxID=2056292 RepID=A0AAD5V6F1_9APHY|nr:hypothetical protein NLI96_g4827 [Physisporinus lineatus]